jgi:hypothetical protein
MEGLDLADRVLTADVLHGQRETTRMIIEDHGTHYVLFIKANQPSLLEAIKTRLNGTDAEFADVVQRFLGRATAFRRAAHGTLLRRGEMTTTTERVSGEGVGGPGGPSGSNSGSFYGEPASAVFARPFLGWLALADAVADTAPDTAELMTAAAYLAQSALEERLPDLIGPLSNVLADSGFSSGAVEGVRSALLANRLAFTPQAVTDELVSLYADLGEEHQLRSGDGPLQLVEPAIERFLDSDLAGPDARAVYDDMAALKQRDGLIHPPGSLVGAGPGWSG